MCHHVQQLRHETMQMFTENEQPVNRRETPCCLGMLKGSPPCSQKPVLLHYPVAHSSSLLTYVLIYFTYLLTYLLTLLTYFITPWSRVLLEKLTGSQLVKKFPAFYGTRKFIAAFTSTRHLSLDQSSPYPHPTS